MNTYFEKDLATESYLLSMYNTAKAAGDEEMMEVIRGRVNKLWEEIGDKGGSYIQMYRLAKSAEERGNDCIDFTDVVWESDIPKLVEAMRQYGIERFTISSGISGMAETIMHFQENGCTLNGIKMVKANYRDITSDEYKVVPAFEIEVN